MSRSIRAACPLCADPLGERSRTTEDELTKHHRRFARCSTCKVLIAADLPGSSADDELDLTDSGRHVADGMVTNARGVAWDLAEHLPPPGTAGPIVDLGIGRGGLPNALQSLGYTVIGCEPSAFLCQMARASYLLGQEVLVNTDPDTFLDNLDIPPGTIAGIVLWHVIDKHSKPLDLLRRCRNLAVGGVIVLELPIADGDLLPADQRFLPTPATVLHLAEELDLTIAAASIDVETGLRVIYRVPSDDLMDLDHHHRLDLPALEEAFREASPTLAGLAPTRSDP